MRMLPNNKKPNVGRRQDPDYFVNDADLSGAMFSFMANKNVNVSFLNKVLEILQHHIQSTQRDSMTRKEFHEIFRRYERNTEELSDAERNTEELSDADINSYFELAAKSAGVDVVYVEDVLNLFRYFADQVSSNNRVDKLKIFFNYLDTDSDGKLSKKELEKGFIAQYGHMSEFSIQCLDILFTNLDKNKDGHISIDEFASEDNASNPGVNAIIDMIAPRQLPINNKHNSNNNNPGRRRDNGNNNNNNNNPGNGMTESWMRRDP